MDVCWFPSHVSFYSCLQQSAAFKILRTRLKTVPSHSFDKEQLKRTSSGMHFADDNSNNDDSQNMHNGINFASWLQRFEQMQQQHRLHYKSQAQSQKSSTSSSKVREVQKPEVFRGPPVPELSRPPSRLSRKGPGQLQL
ncbi:hypothetical protein Tco_0884403 [Tanacetum coccineum]